MGITRNATSFCRFCGAACGVVLTLDEEDRITDIRGDKSNPLSKGYACFKGLQAEELIHGPQRVRRPRKRLTDGSFGTSSMSAALDEIAQRLQAIMDRDGPEAVGVLAGGGSYLSATNHVMFKDFRLFASSCG